MGQPDGIGTPGFGALSAGSLAFVVLLAAGAIWVARHEGLASRLWARLCEVALFGRVVAWARERVSARGWAHRLPAYEVAGIALLAGSAVVVALAAGFTAVLEDVLEGDGIAGIDQPAAAWVATHRDLWLTSALRGATEAGGPVPLAALAALTCAAVVWRCRTWLPVVLALVGVSGIALVIVIAKALVIRNRPHISFAVLAEDGYSFPSGHAAGATAIALFSAWMLTRWLIASWTGRVIAWTVLIGLAAVIGFSRVYLGVHYVSDVVAGWLLGMAWAGIVMLVGSWWDNTRRARARAGGAAPGRTEVG
ncbi:phosphatase PAP2 family protein [Mycobacterium sp. 852002-51057_SCH5723018]|uniref:phosphatase PAP2 family protein n=1 Tax=Mycobacterium sp. 852002-51057_SCH5723018 TaxID=1834094 RepID=UPI000801CD44|nr:phosphatase PAP2 family protein [Mycobacterium sp. 852002-51057_SCH5723018]OBG27094.1 phosphatidic acid phosphatase [Mycobacterium sp. 852002-51057_SCH5723018]